MCSLTNVFLLALSLYFYLVIGSAIFSWLVAFNVVNTRNQFVAMVWEFLHRTTEPALRPIRRFMPDLGGIDISPIVLFLIIVLIQELVRRNIIPVVCSY